MKKTPTVIDFFCGAGGFSEGFRQQGFEIIKGYDHWRPAVETYQFNFGKGKGVLKDLLIFENDHASIEALPDSDVIIGSPPCVSFSNSNRSGKTDKAMGIRLTKVFLRVVTVKKHKRGSTLKAWFMENVVKSIDHVSMNYSFANLGLTKWARENGHHPNSIAIYLKKNHITINSADYGSPQQRIRAVAGEVISMGQLVVPPKLYTPKEYVTLGDVKKALPEPNHKRSNRSIPDPLYPDVALQLQDITDHFYDTGLYEAIWNSSMFQKVNHPYMGRMSFPEREDKPSRTITALNIGTSREAIIYRSEYGRKGNGEFRIPTVREAATLMSFPITFQFIGAESSKYRLVGNAVCPSVSRALARTVRVSMGLPIIEQPIVVSPKEIDTTNLNSFKPKTFDDPPVKKPGSRFRRHPFKAGNITVTLSNYNILKKDKADAGNKEWHTSVQYGNGHGFPCHNYPDGYYKELEPLIKRFENGSPFIKMINNGFSEQVAEGALFQQMYDERMGRGKFLEPAALIDKVARLIDEVEFQDPNFEQDEVEVFLKPIVPKKQVLALYVINKICSRLNQR